MIQQVRLVCSLLEPVKPCHTVFVLPCLAVAPPTLIPLIVTQPVAACSRPSNFCFVFSKLSHQPVLLFLRDPYLLSPAHGESSCLLTTQLVSVSAHQLISDLKTNFNYQVVFFSNLLFSRRIFQRCDGRRDAWCFLPTPPAEVERQKKKSKK